MQRPVASPDRPCERPLHRRSCRAEHYVLYLFRDVRAGRFAVRNLLLEAPTATSRAPLTGSAGNGHAKLFISYSRKDRAFVERLSEALKASGQDTWVDLKDILPSEDWLNAIRSAIEGADAFVFTVSPDSVDPASVCVKEIDHAVAHNKRIIPIVCRPVDTRAVRVSEAIGRLNWVSFIDADGFELSFEKLVAAIETDLEWVKQHTRLLERAVEWDAAKRDDSFLLQKNDLAAAEVWLTLGPTKEPKPTAMQTQYVIDSRTSATKRQRLALGAVSVGFVITIALAIFAWFQRNEAVSEANIALARQLAAQAEVIGSERPNLLQSGVLLAVESLKRYPTLEADQVLRQGVPLLPRAVGRPIKHQGPVRGVAFSPDGTHLATASWDGTASIWEAVTGQPVFTLKPGQVNDRISAVAFSPNGAFLATAGSGGVAQVWDATNGQPFGPPIKSNTYPVMKSVAFSADSGYLATVSESGAHVWEVSANRVANPKVFGDTSVTDEAFPCTPLSSFVFSPGGKHAAAACRGKVRIWDIATWNPVVTIPGRYRPGLNPPLHPIAFSADGKYLASADDIHEVATGNLVHALNSQGPVSAVAFSQDGDYLALAAGDIVRLVNMYDGVSFAELHHRREIRDIAISPSGHEIATASKDNTARIWQVNKYAGDGPTREVTRVSHGGEVSSVAFSPDGKYLATASEDGAAGVWQVSTVQEAAQKIYGGTDEPVVAVSSTGRFLAVSAKDAVQVREVVNGREVGRLVYADNSEPNVGIAQASLSQDGRYLWMTVGQRRSRRGRGALPEIQKIARVWDVSRGEVVATIKYEDIPGIAVFSPDAKHLVAPDGTTLRVWEVIGGREVAPIKYEPAYAAPVFSPDGAHLAIVEPKAIRILETNGWREIRSLPVAEGTSRVVAFSPNSKYIACGSNENVDIWEVTGGRTHESLPVKYAKAILFSPDGKHIVTANWNFYDPSDKSVSIWDSKAQREVDRLQLLEIERADNVDSSPTQLAFTKDGRYLALENQGMLRIWDMLTRRETERWTSQYTTWLAFSPDGNDLLSGHGTTVAVQRRGPEAIIADACHRLSRNLNAGAEWRQYFGDARFRKTCPNIQ
jgi:WD40 repeat protein